MDKSEEKLEKRKKHCKKVYESLCEEFNWPKIFNFNENESKVPEMIHTLVDKCCEIQSEICKSSDSIKMEDYAAATEFTAIDKKTYLDFVNICALKNNDKLKEAAVNKFEEDFYNRLLITNLRHAFLESYMNGEELKITNEDNEEYVPFKDYTSVDFSNLLEKSAQTRTYIKFILNKRYKAYAEAAEYITNGDLVYKQFKKLVDWQYYKDGGYPSPKSPSKIWAIYDKFNEAHRLLSKYQYDDVNVQLKNEFGLIIEETIANPIQHPWQSQDNENEDE